VDVKAGNAYILNELLDITEQDLLSYYLISKEHYQPFLYINTDRKLEVISRFSNTQAVDKAINHLFEKGQSLLLECGDCKNEIAKIQGAIEALEHTLDGSARQEFELNKQKKIEQREARIELLLAQSKDYALKAGEVSVKITSIIDEELDSELKTLIQQELSNLSTASIDKEIVEVKGAIGHIQNYLAGLIECPHCNKTFSVQSDEQFDVADLQNAQELLVELEVGRANLHLQIDDYQESLNMIRGIELANNSNHFERQRLTEQRDRLEQQAKEVYQDAEQALAELEKIEFVK